MDNNATKSNYKLQAAGAKIRSELSTPVAFSL